MYSLKLERIVKTNSFGDVAVTIEYDSNGPKIVSAESEKIQGSLKKQVVTFLSLVNFALINKIAPKDLSKKLQASSEIADLEINKLLSVISAALSEAPASVGQISADMLGEIKNDKEENTDQEESDLELEPIIEKPEKAPEPEKRINRVEAVERSVSQTNHESTKEKEGILNIQLEEPESQPKEVKDLEKAEELKSPKIIEKNNSLEENKKPQHKHSFFKPLHITKPKIEEDLESKEEGVLDISKIEKSNKSTGESQQKKQPPMPPKVQENNTAEGKKSPIESLAEEVKEEIEEDEKPRKFFNPFKRSE